MFIKSTTDALKNKYDNFYYCGVEISKEYFDVTEFAKVCNKINQLKAQLFQEKELLKAKQNHKVVAMTPIAGFDLLLLCTMEKNKCMFGLYSTTCKKIVPLTKEVFRKLDYNTYFALCDVLNKTSKRILASIIEETLIRDTSLLTAWGQYQCNICKLENSFQHTYELEFVNGYKDYILTDEELRFAVNVEL